MVLLSGSGVFAEEDMEKGTFVCFYEGLLFSTINQKMLGVSCFSFDKKDKSFGKFLPLTLSRIQSPITKHFFLLLQGPMFGSFTN
jgi:hypothetical protein